MEGKEGKAKDFVDIGGLKGGENNDNPIASFEPFTLRTAAVVGDLATCEWFISKAKYYLEHT